MSDRDRTLDQLRDVLESSAQALPSLRTLVFRLEAAVRDYWDAEHAYVEHVRLLGGEEAVDQVAWYQPEMWHLRADHLGADAFMFNTQADLRAILEGLRRLSIGAPECVAACVITHSATGCFD